MQVQGVPLMTLVRGAIVYDALATSASAVASSSSSSASSAAAASSAAKNTAEKTASACLNTNAFANGAQVKAGFGKYLPRAPFAPYMFEGLDTRDKLNAPKKVQRDVVASSASSSSSSAAAAGAGAEREHKGN